jgi:hypothetical protein
MCENLCRPYGARVVFPLYPGLTPWANTNSAPAGLIFSHSIHRGKRNMVLTHSLKACSTRFNRTELIYFTARAGAMF